MSQNQKSYLQIIREPIMSREALSFETTISTSQIQRYEADPKSIPHDNMRIIIDKLKNNYIGYLYLMENNVAQLFLPEGVERKSLEAAVLGLDIASQKLFEKITEIKQMALDGKIDESEKVNYLMCKAEIDNFFKSWIEVKCAKGTEV